MVPPRFSGVPAMFRFVTGRTKGLLGWRERRIEFWPRTGRLSLLLASLACSHLGVQQPPDRLTPDRDVECTSSLAAPVADTVGALIAGAPSLYVFSVLVGYQTDYVGLRNLYLVASALGVLAGIAYGQSAMSGFSAVSRCRDLLAQLAPRPSTPGSRAGDSTSVRGTLYQPLHHDAREDLFFSFGVGGGALQLSEPGAAGALGLGIRLGYGFSDRLQLFADFGTYKGFYPTMQITNWLMTLRGQTLLVGDLAGNGLNLNLGFGFGGLYSTIGPHNSDVGPALVAGLSYDVRVARQFALSPELHLGYQNAPRPLWGAEHAWSAGFRLNFVFYASPGP
jgi:hypothetical protein